MKKGYYTATHDSSLFIRVDKVYHISERTGKIKLRASVFYKSNNEICQWITPKGSKNLTLIYSVVKNWLPYEPIR